MLSYFLQLGLLPHQGEADSNVLSDGPDHYQIVPVLCLRYRD
jgi:hypothetical protein